MIGTTIGGRYHIIGFLAQGGFGTTYLAKDKQLPENPVCVVKHLKPSNTDPKAKELFEREAKFLQKLKHPQIPELKAYITENQQFYIVQELIEGDDLTQELPPTSINAKISEDLVIELLKNILEVLIYIHGAGVIHRDLKPSNIMRRQKDNKIVIIDFGSVKPVTPVNNQQLGNLDITEIRTPGYAPKEQGKTEAKFNMDIYAVGMIEIQALTGINPKDLEINNEQVIWRIHNKDEVSDQLANILDKMVKYPAKDRYQKAKKALQALQNISLPTYKIRSTPPQNPFKKSHLFLIIVPVGLIIIIAVIVLSTRRITECDGKLAPYSNSEHHLKIEYPECWKRDETPNINIGKIVTFVQLKQNAKLIISSFDNSKKPRSEPLTLDQYEKRRYNDIKNNLEASNIIERSQAIIANQVGRKIIATGIYEEKKIKNMYVMTLKGNQAYLITYTAPIDDYDKFLPTAEKMIDSLKIN